MLHTAYLGNVIDTSSRESTISEFEDLIKNSGVEFDAIAFTGVSGALVAPQLASGMNKKLIIIRKKDGSHSSLPIEGDDSSNKYIIVDDQITTGATVKRIIGTLRRSKYFKHMQCVGIFLYQTQWVGPVGAATKWNEEVRKELFYEEHQKWLQNTATAEKPSLKKNPAPSSHVPLVEYLYQESQEDVRDLAG
jgi:hypothetical protein